MRIGVLALQGAFIEHERLLQKLGVETVELRQRKDLDIPIDGLILPGGESTVMGKLLQELDMKEDLENRILNGLPVFGTCAGMILLAGQIASDTTTHFGTMDITVCRNAYGRQLGSFFTHNHFGNIKEVPMSFIRAPYITNAGPDVEILSEVDGRTVAARQGNQLVCAFHPELNEDTRVHEYFLKMIQAPRREMPAC